MLLLDHAAEQIQAAWFSLHYSNLPIEPARHFVGKWLLPSLYVCVTSQFTNQPPAPPPLQGMLRISPL